MHLTRGVDGDVHAGPNAVLALAREGYAWGVVDARDLAGTLAFAGLLAARPTSLPQRGGRDGPVAVGPTASPRACSGWCPSCAASDLVPAPAGVRAQAVRPDGSLVDDFLLERHGRVVHLLNAPSPAATAALEIARHVVATL